MEFIASISLLILLAFILYQTRLSNQQKKIIIQQNFELKQLNERLAFGFKHWDEISDLVILHSISGSIIKVNKSITEHLGFEAEELHNQPFQRFLHPDYFDDWNTYIRTVQNKKQFNGIFHLTDDQNRERIFHYKSYLIENNLSSKYVQWIGQEITQKLHLARKLKISDKKFHLLFDILPFGGAILDLEGRIIHCSKNIEKLLGFNPTELIGKSFKEFIESRIIDDVELEFEIKKLETQVTELILIHKNKQRIHTLVYSQPFFDDEEGFLGVLTIHFDITKQKQIQKEKYDLEKQLRHRQRFEALGIFAGGISHDFNNILAVILGFADLGLEELPENHPLTEYLNEIVKAGIYGRDLVRQILSFSRKVEQNFHIIEIKSTLKQAIKLIRALLPSNIEIDSKLVLEERKILSDPVQIHQIILNLATNAFHAMQTIKNGRLKITADLYRPTEGLRENGSLKFQQEYLRILIEDNGIGIETAILDKIFEPFFTTKSAEEGSGLGLSLVRTIIDHHHGQISVKSQVNKGTKFTILLPLVSELRGEEYPKTSTKIYGQGRILMIDDDETLLRMSLKVLNRLGYEVTGTPHPEEAIQLFSDNPGKFDLVITNQIMPHMMGMELARTLKKINQDIPIIVVSGHIEDSNLQFKKEDFVFAYLDKPINPAQFSEIVAKAINQKKETVLVD